MLRAVKKRLPTDIAICAAAISDFKPALKKKNKIKKESNLNEIKIQKNTDVLDFLGKSNRYKPRLLIGFSAETENLIQNSIKKMEEKLCDMIIANDVSKKGSGFNSDFNEVVIIYKNGKTEKIKKNSKKFIASIIAEKIAKKFLSNEKSLN